MRRSMMASSAVRFPRWDAESAFTPSASNGFGLPQPLVDEWQAYALRWKAFLERNPRMHLASLIAWIGETHDGSSWPHVREQWVREWVVSDFTIERPFDDGLGIDRPEWRAELRRTWEQSARGWIFLDQDGNYEWREEGEGAP